MNKNLPWKTGGPTPRRTHLVWPTPGQILGQALIVLVVGGVWAALLFGFLRLTETRATEAQAAASATIVAVAPTHPATVTPPPPPTPSPAAIVAPTVSEPAVEAPTSLPQLPAEPESETSTPVPESTPTPSPLPTEPPASPTETSAESAAAGDSGAVSFSNDVFPIIERRCIKCHGGINDGEQRIEEGLKLTSYEEILAGSYNGPVIEPGDVENSFLIEQIVTGEMPKKEPDLLPAEIRAITAWVEAGAPNN